MQIANEFGREGGGLTSIQGIGPAPEGFSYLGYEDIPPATPPEESLNGLLPRPRHYENGGAFIIGMIILGMSGFRA